MPVRGLIFDCDGTLADTMPLHWRAWETVLCRYPLQFSRERFYSLGGVPSRDILRMLSQEQGIPPGSCRAYEDTDLGLEAIRAAGMEAIDVRQFES